MGIQGLIPFLDKVSSRINISQYKGCCVVVDAYCWLHKGAYTCAEKLAKGEKCDAYVYYCMKYVNMLLSHNIKPILVFDGRHLPAKAETEKKRRESRAMNRRTAAEFLNAGRVDEARNYLRRCVDVTHAMALALIQECRKINVDCIVAPYEADAQLAYLNIQNIAQVVITEDSDLILFGCSKIIFKLDLQGFGLLVERERLHFSMGVRAENFNFDSFRYMCILSGCDYLPSLPGIGLNKALKFINKTRDPDIHRALRRIPAYLNMSQLSVSDEYRDAFLAADATFRYQPVFDPRTRAVVPLTEPPEGEDPPTVMEEQLPPDVAFDLALGNLDPFSLERVDNFHPDDPAQRRSWGPSPASAHASIWSRDCRGSYAGQPKDEGFPGTLKHCTVLDVTSLRARAPHSVPLTPAASTADESALPSQADLQSMYGSGTAPIAQPCGSNTPTLSSPGRNPEAAAVPSGENQRVDTSPSSPILSQRKSRNPFAKSDRHCSVTLRTTGTTCRPNFFSALRKFEGIYPMNPMSDTIVVSRRLGTAIKNQPENIDSQDDDVLKDVSNTSSFSNHDVLLDEEAIVAGYSQQQEHGCEPSAHLNKSRLAAIEEVQSKAYSSSASVQPRNAQKAGQEVNREQDDMDIDLDEEENVGFPEVDPFCVKNPSPSFNWKQFACRKSLSSSKLMNSPAATRTFKNPFRKMGVSKTRTLEVKDCDELGAAEDIASCPASTQLLQESPKESAMAEKHHAPLESPPAASSMSSDNLLGLPQKKNADDVFHTGVDLVSSMDSPLGPWGGVVDEDEQLLDSAEMEVIPMPLSSGSSDSGFQDSQEMPSKNCWLDCVKTGNNRAARPSASKRDTTPGRRLGLGRSTPNQASPKQNLLAQYGFLKKRKLAH